MPEFIHVNSDDTFAKFNNIKKDKILFVKYYMNGCGHCIELESVWDKFEESVKLDKNSRNIVIVKMNASHLDTIGKTVIGYPTISVIKNNIKLDYDGPRTVDGIKQFYKMNTITSTSQSGGKSYKKKSYKN